MQHAASPMVDAIVLSTRHHSKAHQHILQMIQNEIISYSNSVQAYSFITSQFQDNRVYFRGHALI